jgi:hypothetical protein
MSNVISITDQEDWNTMSLVHSSLSYYKENNQLGKFNNAIEKEQDILEWYKRKYNIGA